MLDAPWVKASERHCHEFLTPCGLSVMLARVPLAEGVRDKDVLEQVLYGCGEDGQMLGLSAMFNTTDPNDAQNAVNVISAGGRRNLTSAWLIGWSLRGVHMVSGDGYPVRYSGDVCVAVPDWRFVVRVANIEEGSGDLLPHFDRAQRQLAVGSNVRPVWYASRDVAAQLPWPVRVVDELRHNEEFVGPA